MRIVLSVIVITLSLMEICFAATYIKASDNQIGVVTEKTETMTIAEIKHEIEGIQNDIVRIEEAKQPFLDRLEKYEACLAQCSVLGVKEPVIAPVEPIKPIEEPIIEEEHTI